MAGYYHRKPTVSREETVTRHVEPCQYALCALIEPADWDAARKWLRVDVEQHGPQSIDQLKWLRFCSWAHLAAWATEAAQVSTNK